MAINIKIDTKKLQDDATIVNTNIKNIINSVNNLLGYVEKLDSHWDGASSEIFKSEFIGDLHNINTLISNLNNLNAYEFQAKEKYDDCEKQIANTLSSI